MKSSCKTVWLIFSVFLFYHDIAVVAINLRGNRFHGMYGKKFNRDFKDTTGESCDKWEEYDGVDCVCASTNLKQSHCDGESGMVCDDHGVQYQSKCHFALAMCQERISIKRKLKSCGSCKWIKVSYSKPKKTPQSIYFRKSGNGIGYEAQYKSLGLGSLLFFEKKLNSWVIGFKNRTGTFVSMVQEEKGPFPQDSDGAMLVVKGMKASSAILKTDPYFTINCVKDVNVMSIKKHRKRFIFTLITVIAVAVSVAAVATSTTLKIVQAKKGCLYYPSVCTLRDEIKYTLKPQVESLKRSFFAKYGDPHKIKENIERIQELISDINDAIIEIKQLHVKSNATLSELTEHLGSIALEDSNVATLLSDYENWLKEVKQQMGWNIIGFEVEIAITMLTLPSMIGAAATALSAGLAIVGSLVAIGLAIADIVSSVNAEKETKKKLTHAKSEYIRARSNLQKAHADMIKLQKAFCKNVINYLRKLSESGGSYKIQLFSKLHEKIIKIYGASENSCNKERVYSKTNLKTLVMLKKSHLEPISKYLSGNVKDLKKNLTDISALIQSTKEIIKDVKIDRKSPARTFEVLKMTASSKFFPNLFKFLQYIAKDILPTTDCYWGSNLTFIRTGKTTEKNYLRSAICPSPEIQDQIDIIKTETHKVTIPCLIYGEIRGSEFRTKYSVIRFIADHILPKSNCYWGYDLQAIRKESNAREVEKAKMTSVLFPMLQMFSYSNITIDIVQKAKAFLCSKSMICNESWQSFILCFLWKNSVDSRVLNCKRKLTLESEKYCVPPQNDFQECK